ncbi:MerC mercury resistance protein [Rubripirellula obstinata]|uniref:MerC mercury resistance protein n=1 Tax=Rubripirellula obstinata TaxID=406547 RepID=A0A5B1CMB6_9BACT|nr:MerC domain-containing protein [Rubripirellula obstinata]KAA1261045.1 MerC mercury resistance protein [Rubripirellula obstinata]
MKPDQPSLTRLPIATQGLATSSVATIETSSRWQDYIGIVASIGCAIHCAAMPFVISFLPALGLSFLADEAFHRWMALACFVIAMAAFVPGFRQHRRLVPGAIAVVGLSLITVAAYGFAGDCCASCESPTEPSLTAVACTDACCEKCVADQEIADLDFADQDFADQDAVASIAPPAFLTGLAPWITPLGGMLLVSAHLLNRRYGCLCGCCETEPSSKTTS